MVLNFKTTFISKIKWLLKIYFITILTVLKNVSYKKFSLKLQSGFKVKR